MKNVFKLTAVIALFLTTSINASETKLGLTPNATKSLTFSLDTNNQETAIRLIDSEGNIIFSEEVANKETYLKRFDLSKLEKGMFYLEVEDDLREIVYNIELGDLNVVIKDRHENAKPVFRKSGKVVYLNLLNLEKKAVKITITDSADRVVFEETVKDEALVGKVFNFDGAYDDTYQVVVVDNNDTYYENIVVK